MYISLTPITHNLKPSSGFTLVETLVAISLLSIAIVAPMTLTTQSLMGAYYARDQVTAFFLAQEAIEAVRSVRDANVLTTALGTPTDLMAGIPSTGSNFTVDAHTVPVTMTICSGTCPPLQTDGELYGYNFTPAGSDTNFTRYVTATYVPGTSDNEIKISATVVWQTAAYEPRTFTLSENLYRWIFDSAAQNQVTAGCESGATSIGSNQCRAFLTSGSSWTVPTYWSSTNTIEVVGGGGGGGARLSGAGLTALASGAGGGGYSRITNLSSLTPGASVSYTVGIGGTGGSTATLNTSSNGLAGGDTWFNGATLAGSSVGAKGGGFGLGGTVLASTQGGQGGQAGSGVGATKFSGGRGGNPGSIPATMGTGAGGAAGPNGDGSAGGDQSGSGFTAGGSSDAGNGGAGGAFGGSGSAGGNGSQYGTVGTGGGGGGNATTVAGETRIGWAGGLYGGGGAGSAISAASGTATGGAGQPGLIVITYTMQ